MTMTIRISHATAFHDDHDQVLSNSEQEPSTTLPTSMAWMPLEGAAQQWATFAGTFLSYSGFTAASAIFSALSLEARALRQYEHVCHRRFNGDELHARAACEQTVHDLQDACSQWMSALYWLERLAGDRSHALDEEERASLRSFFAEATEHLQRVGLLTQQVQEACVLCYQQQGMLAHEEEG
jgi:hypothetical protein